MHICVCFDFLQFIVGYQVFIIRHFASACFCVFVSFLQLKMNNLDQSLLDGRINLLYN